MSRTIIQLTRPIDRFRKFNKRLDEALIALDELGTQYPDLGFNSNDLIGLTKQEELEFKEELTQHGQMVLGLVHHPLVMILTQSRNNTEQSTTSLFELPVGVWQHYKGTYYEMIGPVTSTDHHSLGVLYKEKDNPESKTYCITLSNFYTMKEVNGELVNRFTKIS